MADERQLFYGELAEPFLEAYDQFAGALYRHAFFRVFSKQIAEEILQEAFLRAWQYVSHGRKVENWRAFLYRILNNLIIDEARRKKETSLDQLLEEAFPEPAGDQHRQIERLILLRDVINQLRELPEDSKQVMLLHYVDDLDIGEIAQILETTTNNVSVRLHRARMMLKTKI